MQRGFHKKHKDYFLVRIFPLAHTKILTNTNEYIQAYMFNVEFDVK